MGFPKKLEIFLALYQKKLYICTMKNFWSFIKQYHSYLWLVAALAYANLGSPDMVTPMILFFLVDDVFDKIEAKMKSSKRNESSLN
jgi:hypothetical protein